MSTDRKVSAIIVNYNGLGFIGDCLQSLLGEPSIAEVILVDNASRDGSPAYIQAQFPDVKILPAGGNLGFGRACNLGARAAQGDFLLLLNYDAALESGLAQALDHLDTHPETALVGGKLTFPDGRPQPSIGNRHHPLRIIASWIPVPPFIRRPNGSNLEVQDEAFYLRPHRGIPWVTGAFMLIRRSCWEEVGGMDPGFFMYVEDVDLCERLARSGGGLDYLPAFTARHRKGGGASHVSPRALLSTLDSYRLYLGKHHGRPLVQATLILIGLALGLRALALAPLALKGPDGRKDPQTYLRGAFRALRLGLGHRFAWGPPD